MKLSELKSLLSRYSGLHFRLRLPDGDAVPVSFHVTEVGHVRKVFLDCGGTRREQECCLLQVWVGKDHDHRIETTKMAGILEKGSVLMPHDSLPVEIEYEDRVLSQYVVDGHDITDDAVVLTLSHKHTACLAPELCGLPADGFRLPPVPSSACGPSGCC